MFGKLTELGVGLRGLALATIATIVAGASQPAQAQTQLEGISATRTLHIAPGEVASLAIAPTAKSVTVSRRAVVDVSPHGDHLELQARNAGASALVFEGADGQVLEVIDVQVGFHVKDLARRLNSELADSRIEVVDLGWGLLLQGEVATPEAAARAEEIAQTASLQRVVSNLVVRPPPIMLKLHVYQLDAGAKAEAPRELTALEASGAARRIAEPTLLTRSGETASLRMGGERLTSSGFRPYGIAVDITPAIQAGGDIRLTVAGAGYDADGAEVPAPGATAEIGDGASVVLGGLPAAPADKSLLVLVTPHVVKASTALAAAAPTPEVRQASVTLADTAARPPARAPPGPLARMRTRLARLAMAPLHRLQAAAHAVASAFRGTPGAPVLAVR